MAIPRSFSIGKLINDLHEWERSTPEGRLHAERSMKEFSKVADKVLREHNTTWEELFSAPPNLRIEVQGGPHEHRVHGGSAVNIR